MSQKDNSFEKLVKNKENTHKIVSNLLTRLAFTKTEITNRETLKKIEADMFITLVDKFIDEAISYKSDSILNSTQR